MLSSLEDLYVEELKDLYSAEHLMLQTLPKMEQAALKPQVKKAFRDHLEQTRGQVQRLERIFEGLNRSPKGKACKGMKGIVEEGQEFLGENPSGEVCDAGLIASAQRAEHYEMAAYGCCRTWAKELGRDDDVSLLQQTLDEEGETDKKLTALAEKRGVNEQAMQKAA